MHPVAAEMGFSIIGRDDEGPSVSLLPITEAIQHASSRCLGARWVYKKIAAESILENAFRTQADSET